jgi:hypothetical protein
MIKWFFDLDLQHKGAAIGFLLGILWVFYSII